MTRINDYRAFLLHPDEISDLAPDCRRVLRTEYATIESRAAQLRPENRRTVRIERDPYGQHGTRIESRRETTSEAVARVGSVGAAIAEYRRVAALWGVNVDRAEEEAEMLRVERRRG